MRFIGFILVLVGLAMSFQTPLLAQPGLQFPSGEAGKDFNRLNQHSRREGAWIRVYKNKPKVLYYRGQYSDGIPAGEWEFYDQDGFVISKVNHVQDTTINDVKFYYKEGGIMAEGRFVGKWVDQKWTRVKEGEWKLYHTNQTLSTLEHYKNGQRDGNVKLYTNNGQIVIDENYSEGQKNGPFVEWSEKGVKLKEGRYVYGNLEGDFATYYESGSIREKGTYTHGQYDKVWRFYHDGGRDKVIIHYNMGEIEKKVYVNIDVEEYFESGVPKLFCTYEKGKRQGPFKEYFDVGHFEVYEASEEDKKIGIMERQKLVGAVIAVEGDYLDGNYEGEITFRNKDGSVNRVETWEGGKMVKTTAKNN